MSIHIGQLKSFSRIAELAEYLEWPRVSVWMEGEDLAWLITRLKHVPDNPKLFAHGKWATLQEMELLLNEEAAQDVAEDLQKFPLETLYDH